MPACLPIHARPGGAVVLLPDSQADARTAARWLPVPAAAEVLLEQPARLSAEAPLASIHASEMLTLDPSPILRALASNGANQPVIGVVPVGAGQLIVSGALDAWRFRANDRGAYDRFWQAAIAGFAGAAPGDRRRSRAADCCAGRESRRSRLARRAACAHARH
jgi:hypothetical protein